MADHVLTRWFSFAGGIVVIEPMVNIYLKGIWSTWHKTLEVQRPEDLRHMSEKLWENTLRPPSTLLNRATSPREFCLNVTGEFLNWEVIGIIVSLVSLLAQSLKGETYGSTLVCMTTLTFTQMETQFFAPTTKLQWTEPRLLSRCTMPLKCVSASATSLASSMIYTCGCCTKTQLPIAQCAPKGVS
jgi:hypothetical protein